MNNIYNDIYEKQSNASRQRRIPFYIELAKYINETDNVIDLGCGNGMLAHLSKWNKYTGVDFSEVAIKQAKKICPNAQFVCSQIDRDYIEKLYKQDKLYDITVMTEFLEHMENDLDIIDSIIQNMRVLISVPNNEPLINGLPRGFPTHQRAYTIDSIRARYKNINFSNIYVYNNWIISIGIKR